MSVEENPSINKRSSLLQELADMHNQKNLLEEKTVNYYRVYLIEEGDRIGIPAEIVDSFDEYIAENGEEDYDSILQKFSGIRL